MPENPHTGRKPPQNIDAEQAVLGGVLLDNNVMHEVVDALQEEDFYKDAHQKIFGTMLEMTSEQVAIDYLTLEERLTARGFLETSGGASYLAHLTDVVPTAANTIHYARIVRDKAIARRLIEASTQIIQAGFDSSDDLDAYLATAEQLIFNITQKRQLSGVTHLKSLIKKTFETIETIYARKDAYTGVASGFGDLDKLTTGFQPADLVIIASRPSMGKTTLALNIAQHAALHADTAVMFFSLEMSKESLAMRMLCAEARVDFQHLRLGQLTDADWAKLARAAGLLSEACFYIDDSPAIRVMEMRAKARRLHAELQKQGKKLGMILMDYLQLASPSRKIDSREREISEISASLKGLAKEIGVPVIALSQLSRKPEGRESKRPQLSDLRESGAIEQDADVILFIYRDEVYNKDTADKGIAELIIGKQRNGPIGTVRVRFSAEHSRFDNLAHSDDD